MSSTKIETDIQSTKEFTQMQVALAQVGLRVVGQERMVERLLIGLVTGGHVLLEGVPGLAKTLAVSTLSEIISVQFSRIQFTPDLLPADLIGTMVFNPKTQDFSVKKGPIFANIVLADEINRAPAKVQAALLEAMQERQVTIGGTTFPLDEPFLVLATQNPIESEGTYPLPEAQLDRFLMKVRVGYPTRDEEREVLARLGGDQIIPVEVALTPDVIRQARADIAELYLDQKLADYIVAQGSQAAGRLRGVSPGHAGTGPGLQSPRVYPRAELRNSRRHSRAGPGRVAPPYRADVRSRGRRYGQRRHHHPRARHGRGPLSVS